MFAKNAAGHSLVLLTIIAILFTEVVVIGYSTLAGSMDQIGTDSIRLFVTIALCVFLYAGANWARWVTGILSILSVTRGLLTLIEHPATIASRLSLLLLILMHATFVLLLLFVPAVKSYFATKSTPPAMPESNPTGSATVAVGLQQLSTLSTLLLVLCLSGAYVIGSVIWRFEAEARERKLLTDELKRLVFMYHEFRDTFRRSPSNLDELVATLDLYRLRSRKFYHVPRAIEMIFQRRFVMIWDAKLLGDGDLNDKYILGYESTAPESGGLVMSAGGSVRELTANEFVRLQKIATE